MFDIIYNNSENIKKSKNLRPFANFPPDAKLIPTKPIMLDVVRFDYSVLRQTDLSFYEPQNSREERGIKTERRFHEQNWRFLWWR